MDIGLLVQYDGCRWQVYKATSQTRTSTLIRPLSEGGAETVQVEVADDDPQVKVICDPRKWPFVTAPRRPASAGPVVAIQLTRKGKPQSLVLLEEWAPSDIKRPGGGLFLNPTLQLRLGESLRIGYADKSASVVTITRGFGTSQQRTQPKSKPPEGFVELLGGDGLFKD